MNNIILNQLHKCKVANIPEFDNSDTLIIIKKTTEIKPENMMNNHLYLIKIKDSVLKNKTIANNWNNGNLPKYQYYQVEKLDIIGNMVKLNGVAVENNNIIYSESFYGYLPVDGFEIIEEI